MRCIPLAVLVVLAACGDAGGPGQTPVLPTVAVQVTVDDGLQLCGVTWRAQMEPTGTGTEGAYQIWERVNGRWQGIPLSGRFRDSAVVAWDHGDSTAWPYVTLTRPATILVFWTITRDEYPNLLNQADTTITC